jgi:hypothetical protein
MSDILIKFQSENYNAPKLRVNRLMRLVEFNAPQDIIKMDYNWFQVQDARAEKTVSVRTHPTPTRS